MPAQRWYSRDIGQPDAIVMLASHEWERLPAAAALSQQYPESLVILTVPITVTKWNCHQCPARPAQLQAEGITADRIVELSGDPAANTYGEALSVRRLAERSSHSKAAGGGVAVPHAPRTPRCLDRRR